MMLDKSIRRDIRREGFKNVKRRFFLNILVVFIVSLVVNGGYSLSTRQSFLEDDSLNSTVTAVENAEKTVEKTVENAEKTVANGTKSGLGMGNEYSNTSVLVSFICNTFDIDMINPDTVSSTSTKYYSGVASVFFNEITGSQSFVFGIINGLNQLLFKGKIANSIIIFVFAIISIFIFVFLKNVIEVGKNRYYLEQRRYSETGPGEILFPYKNKRLKHIAGLMFVRYVFQSLWNLTIVGGIIKHYEYLLIPYIVAENPEVGKRDAFKISKELMMGDKYKAFLIEFSMLPWAILSYFTFNLTSVFFSDAYIECVMAELYMRIRTEKKDSLPLELRKWLNDDMLAIDHVENRPHPSGEEKLDIPTVDIHSLKSDYMRSYSLLSVIELFFAYSLAGWLWEMVFYLAQTGEFVNRGMLHGPWLPIYGCGGVLIILLLKPFREKPALLFFTTVIVCGVVEYFTSWILEVLFDSKWWDYTGYFMNLNGRICLEGLLVFGMAGLAFTYIISPLLDDIFTKMKDKYRWILCIILILIFIADFIWSLISPNVGEGITSGLV